MLGSSLASYTSKTQSIVRVFLALPFSYEWKHKIAAFRHTSMPCHKVKDISWVPLENYHTTVVFIGSVKLEDIPQLEHGVTEAIQGSMPFDLHPASLEVYERWGRGLVWLRFRKSEEYIALVNSLTRTLGLELGDNHDRIAHVTLGRFRGIKRQNRIVLEDQSPYRAKSLALFHSQLSSRGSTYTEMRRWKLGNE